MDQWLPLFFLMRLFHTELQRTKSPGVPLSLHVGERFWTRRRTQLVLTGRGDVSKFFCQKSAFFPDAIAHCDQLGNKGTRNEQRGKWL